MITYRIALMYLIVVASLVVGSCTPIELSDEQAMTAIRGAKKLPEPVSLTIYNVKDSSPLGQEVLRLVREGFIISAETLFVGYTITEKGKPYVKKCIWNRVYGEYEVLELITHKKDILAVNEIILDKQARTAKVSYSVGVRPTEYFDQLRKLDPKIEGVVPAKWGQIERPSIMLAWDKVWYEKK